jgi:hypothetical protein
MLSIFRTPTDISRTSTFRSSASSRASTAWFKGRPSRTHTSHPEEEATKPPASSLLLGFPDTDYPLQGKTIVVTRCGRICQDKKQLISAKSLPDKPSASKKSTTTYGWSALL